MVKKYWLISLILAAFLAWGIIQFKDYPPMVKNNYFKNPLVMILALWQQTLPGNGITLDKAKEIAKKEGAGEIRSVKLIYLCAINPDIEGITNTRGKYFASLSKVHIVSKEELFWQIKGWQEELLLEYSTGKIVFYQRQAQILIPEPPDGRQFVMPVANFGFKNYTLDGITTLFVEGTSPKAFRDFADRVQVKGYQDFQSRVIDNRKWLVDAFLRLEERASGTIPPEGTDQKYLDILAKIEKTFAQVWGDEVQNQMIIPIYIEKAKFQGKSAWIVVCNWRPAKDLEEPGAREKGISLTRRAILVIATQDYQLLYSHKD